MPNIENFYSPLTVKKVSDKEYEHVLKVLYNFKMKMMKDYHKFYLKCDVLCLADAFKIMDYAQVIIWAYQL